MAVCKAQVLSMSHTKLCLVFSPPLETLPWQPKMSPYTLFHPENDRDFTECTQGYTLQEASFMRQSRRSFLNAWENPQVARAVTSVFVGNTLWHHGSSRGETKYSAVVVQPKKSLLFFHKESISLSQLAYWVELTVRFFLFAIVKCELYIPHINAPNPTCSCTEIQTKWCSPA